MSERVGRRAGDGVATGSGAAASPRDGTTALVVAAHGSHLNPRSTEPAFAHAERLREHAAFDEVRAAFWKNEPSLRGVLATLESDEAVVVPLFTSEGYFVEAVLPREFGLADGHSVPGPETVRYADPVGTHERATDVIRQRAESVTGDPDVGPGVGLAVVGHGTECDERSARATRTHARRLRERGRFAEVRALFMDEPPYVDDLTDQFDAREIVLVPLFVADGYHTTEDVPEDAGLTDDHRDGWDVPAEVDGHRVWYAGAVGTEPGFADVILERAREAGAEPGPADDPADSPSRGRPSLDPDGHRRAFLDWVDAGRETGGTGEDGPSRTWGELAVEATRDGAGRRRYALRHRDDLGRPRSDLSVHADPAAARELARYDDGGRFRPLAGARSLQRGWALVDLGGPGLLRAVEDVYPGSVAAWHREREGDLAVTHFDAAAARQTGIYECVADADREDVACAVAACCGDCVRRRAWDAAEDDPLDAPRGDGAFPCREPCSVLVAALREWMDLEPNGDDAPAPTPDPSVRAGAVDAPGNRYRERFLAAKRARQVSGETAVHDGGEP